MFLCDILHIQPLTKGKNMNTMQQMNLEYALGHYFIECQSMWGSSSISFPDCSDLIKSHSKELLSDLSVSEAYYIVKNNSFLEFEVTDIKYEWVRDYNNDPKGNKMRKQMTGFSYKVLD